MVTLLGASFCAVMSHNAAASMILTLDDLSTAGVDVIVIDNTDGTEVAIYNIPQAFGPPAFAHTAPTVFRCQRSVLFEPDC